MPTSQLKNLFRLKLGKKIKRKKKNQITLDSSVSGTYQVS